MLPTSQEAGSTNRSRTTFETRGKCSSRRERLTWCGPSIDKGANDAAASLSHSESDLPGAWNLVAITFDMHAELALEGWVSVQLVSHRAIIAVQEITDPRKFPIRIVS
jgi:hypothetical protein